MDISKRIIILEGVDTSGKTALGRALAEHYGLDFIDNEYLRDRFRDFKSKEWETMVAGINLQQAQFVKSTCGFVKTRYSLTERVYTAYYGRQSIINADDMEAAGLGKALVLLVRVSYEKYHDLWKRFRRHEYVYTEAQFNYQSELFNLAFDECQLGKAKLNNDSSFEDLVDMAKLTIAQLIYKEEYRTT